MVYDLKSRNVLVTGGSRGIGEAISEAFAAEGANVAINYYSRSSDAETLQKRLSEKHPDGKFVTLQGDIATKEGCEGIVKETVEKLGGVDGVVSNAGWTKFTENYGDLDALTEEDWDRCWSTNVKAQLWLFKASKPTFESNPSGGVFLICSSIAGIHPTGSSMAYSVTKAAGLHLMRCLVASQGPKVRVNCILPGLVLTEWGQKFPEARKEHAKNLAQLKKHTEAEDVAAMFVAAARNESMTGQKIAVDAGLVV